MTDERLVWKKILVGVDGSEYAEKALKQAGEISKRFSAELTVINVYHDPTAQDVSQKISGQSKEILEDKGVKFNLVSFLSYNTPKVITDMVGSRGMGAVAAWLVGSVCNRICYDSPIGVLIVK